MLGRRRSRPPVRVLAVAVVMCAVSDGGAAILARSTTVCGDSISRGFNANEDLCTYGDQVARVWATGDDHGGNLCGPGADGTFSHAERLECAQGGSVAIFNDAESGADMLTDFYEQAASARRRLTASSPPRYVSVFMGHNDACTDTVAKAGNGCGGDRDPDNYCRTTDRAFERELRRGLDQLVQIPHARVQVLATARVSELCNFEQMNGCGLTFGLSCDAVWSLPFVDICRSLTEDCSNQRRIDMYETLVGYNEILAAVTDEYAALPAGTRSPTGAVKADDVVLRFNPAPFQYKFRPGDVSCCDCFHPSDQAHALLSEVAWNGLECSPETPCCAETGDPLVDASCDVEDQSSFYEGGFWAGDETCGNGIVDPGEPCADGAICAGPRTLTAVRLVLGGLGGSVGDERMSFRGEMVLLGDEGPLDPRATGMRVVLAGPAGALIDASLPPGDYDGSAGWEQRGDAFVYRNRTATAPGGILHAVIRDRSRRELGLVHIEIRSRGAALPVGAGALPLRLTVALDPPSVAGDRCGEAALGGVSVPACELSAADGRLVCR
jgi:lysophospholipase L1-like esterase